MKAVFLLSVVLIVAASASHEEESDGHYSFEYGVSDPHTGDEKSQYEYRDGKHVKGGYVVKEADGTTRIVEYEADPHNGFNAVVKRIGHAQHPEHYGHDGYGHESEENSIHGGTSYVGTTHHGY